MAPVYPTRKVYIDLDRDGVCETDISSRVVSDIQGQNGIFSYRETERLSGVGNLSFSIRNSDGAYTNAATIIGCGISITLTLGTREKQIFYGYISPQTIIDSTDLGNRRMHIQVVDWMSVAQGTRVRNVSLATFVTADEALPTLLGIVPNPPANTNFDNGYERFPNMFDGALKNTVVYSELDKITKSELGYLYLKFRESAVGETLRFENYLARGSTDQLSAVPSDVATPFFLKYHGNAGASGYLKFHGNAAASGKLKLAQAQSAYFDRTMVNSELEEGPNVVNQMSVNNVPRDTDASLVVLYSISSPIQVGTTQTYIIDGAYSDPNGGTVIQAKDVVFAIGDYEFNSARDGLGTDLKVNLSVNFFAWPNSFTITFVNNGPPGYLTLVQVRGKGIYKYSQIETLRENIDSQENIVRNIYSDSITREYSNDYNTSETFANGVLAVDRAPRKVMKSVSFVANSSEHLMLAFMYLEQGDKVQIVGNKPSRTGNYYIQGVTFSILLGGIVLFTWFLKEDVETIGQPIAVRTGTNNAGNRSAIDFGILPYLANLSQFSYSFWIKRLDTSTFTVAISKSADDGSGRRGNFLIINTNGDIEFHSYKTPGDGAWEAAAVLGQDVWEHVVVTYDNTSDQANPMMWVDGVSQTVSETAAPSGSSDDDSDCPLVLFNASPDPTVPSERYFYDVLHDVALKDVRIYNRILTSAEIAALYAGEDDYSTVQTGLLFNGIYAPTDNIDDYINDTILADDLVLDSVHMAAGVPYNEDESADTETLFGLTP